MVDDMDGGVEQQVESGEPAQTVTGESLVSRVSSGLGRLGPVAAIALFGLAILVLHRELAAYSYRDITRSIEQLSPTQLLLGIGFTVLAYAVFPGYDAIALSYIRHPLPFRRTALGSFIAYSFSQTLGFPLLTGGSVRYRLWSSWGLSSAEIAKAVSFVAFSFGLGMIAVSGVVFVLEPASTAEVLRLPLISLRPIGVLNLLIVAGYATWSMFRRRPVHLFGRRLPVPRPELVATQLLVAALDWAFAGAALYVLLPPGHGLAYLPFLGIFLIAQFAGLVSHIPGGLGIVETILVVLLKPHIAASALLGALIAYRGVYYLLPFGAGVVVLGTRELRPYGARAFGLARSMGGWAPRLLPQVLSGAVFLTGVILLISGATPPAHGRMAWMGHLLPLGVIELSHFLGSLAGAGLLVLAWGLWHRLDAAFGLTVAVLGIGIGASLLKGGDWEEALALTVVLGSLLPARSHFYRKSALVAEPLEASWILAIAVVVGTSVWLGFFAHKHVQYQNELWWRFALHADAPRFLRATVGVVGLLLVFGLMRLLRHAPPEMHLPDRGELDRAAQLIADGRDSSANLILVGDKALLWSSSARGLLSYGASGRSWVALGDPIGDEEEREELAWRFRELADRHGGWTAFYEVGVEHLPLYIDLGLTLMKLGEEARVPLASFSLEGSNRRALRRTQRQMERDGVTFAVIPPAEVPALLPQLRLISDSWLQEKRTREKGFSLGRFDEQYISRFPIALARQEGAILAFANIWSTLPKTELSIDLMRYTSAAPGGVMQFIFTELMLWGRAQGYRSFRLGMAPFSGLESRTLAPLWTRVGALMYRYGEHFYNFQGLREYKEKFDPVWEPRYLASPGGLALPRVLTSIATLIGGGIKGVVAK
jgi:phosphatidylglycerol lysyltransferase